MDRPPFPRLSPVPLSHSARTMIYFADVNPSSPPRPEQRRPVKDALRIAELLLACSLIVLILMQSRGTSLGSVFGQEGSVFHTRRGAERVLFNVTIGVSLAFLAVSLGLAHVG